MGREWPPGAVMDIDDREKILAAVDWALRLRERMLDHPICGKEWKFPICGDRSACVRFRGHASPHRTGDGVVLNFDEPSHE